MAVPLDISGKKHESLRVRLGTPADADGCCRGIWATALDTLLAVWCGLRREAAVSAAQSSVRRGLCSLMCTQRSDP